MKGERRYSIGAGIADFYVVGIGLGASAGFYVAVARRPVPPWEPFLVVALSLALVVLYHTRVARRVMLRSVGEVLMGRVVVDGGKRWQNPYGANRTGLFAVVFIALVLAGNSWDSAADGRFYATLTLPVVLGRVAFLGCLLAGVVMAGRVQFPGAFLVAAYFGLNAIAGFAAAPHAGVSANVTRGVGGFHLAMALVSAIVLARYRRLAADKAMQPSGGTVG